MWFVGKRALEAEVARQIGDDVRTSLGALDKEEGHYSIWLNVHLEQMAPEEAVEARRLLRKHGRAMRSETYGIALAFLVSCHTAARS